jgi:hypothetical protein
VGASQDTKHPSIHILESFSGITPSPQDNEPNNSMRLPWVFTHMSIHDDSVINSLAVSILKELVVSAKND